MKKTLLSVLALGISSIAFSQSPAVTSWLQNTTATGSHYVQGNSTPIQDNDLVNVQMVQYSNDFSYITTEGVPSYPTGPFLDGNPSTTTAQGVIYEIPLNPVENTGNPAQTGLGAIGVFINGVALFDYQDGVSYNLNAGQDQGGPGGGMGDGVWNRDAIVAENDGFDCSKGHPAMGEYHHHQNPSAFKLDLNTVSTICNLYDADALYSIDSTQHSPLIGYAFDGFPIYGAYGYANTDGTGGITRIKSSYQLRNITDRTHYADGTDVTDGPSVSTTHPLGHYREDYEYIAQTGEDYVDDHNGRFCVTPEYPNGTYAYFATVDENWNSAFPYVIGSYYGIVDGGRANTVPAGTNTYNPTTSTNEGFIDEMNFSIFPNPTQEFIAVQANGLVKNDIELKLYDISGKVVRNATIKQGSTIWYMDIQTLYSGNYIMHISDGETIKTQRVSIAK